MARPGWNGERLVHPDFDDHYGPDNGGLGEAAHVFIDAVDLPKRWSEMSPDGTSRIGDLGFGTGRNTWAIICDFLHHAPSSARLEVHAFERDPLSAEDARKSLTAMVSRAPAAQQERYGMLLDWFSQAATAFPTALPGVSALPIRSPRVRVFVHVGDACAVLSGLALGIEHWCLDAFAPSVNPNLWSDTLFRILAHNTVPNGTLSTWSAAGNVRRNMINAGFLAERRPGYGNKREMLVGRRNLEPTTAPSLRFPWPAASSGAPIAVIGAGIAGATVARELAEAGLHVDVFEAQQPGAGASGNPWGLAQPLPNLGASPIGAWATSGFVYARALAARLDLPWHDTPVARYGAGHRDGHTARILQELDWGNLLESPDAITDAWPGAVMGIQSAAILPPIEWCRALLRHPQIQVHTETPIQHILPHPAGWRLGNHVFSHVVWANSIHARDLFPELALAGVRGQLVQVPATPASRAIRRSSCGAIYLLPNCDGHHVLGATYHRDDDDLTQRTDDTRWLLDTLQAEVPAAADALHIDALDLPALPGRVAIRGVTPGRLPYVGPLVREEAVRHHLAPRRSDRPQLPEAACTRGLWLTVGHGSRGLVGAPLAAVTLARAIQGEPPIVSAALLDAIHPARDLVQAERRR